MRSLEDQTPRVRPRAAQPFLFLALPAALGLFTNCPVRGSTRGYPASIRMGDGHRGQGLVYAAGVAASAAEAVRLQRRSSCSWRCSLSSWLRRVRADAGREVRPTPVSSSPAPARSSCTLLPGLLVGDILPGAGSLPQERHLEELSRRRQDLPRRRADGSSPRPAGQHHGLPRQLRAGSAAASPRSSTLSLAEPHLAAQGRQDRAL